jgi:FKBP-type peptidyl-prolyl cis-trans isomerase
MRLFPAILGFVCIVAAVGCNRSPAVEANAQPQGELKIEDVEEGAGHAAQEGDHVWVQYRGTLQSDGSEFDSNFGEEKPPFHLRLGSGTVIKGWEEGLLGIQEGGTRTLTIPPHMGYGAEGSGDRIPPNSWLVFEVKALAVRKDDELDILDIEEVKKGEGRSVRSGDTVTVTYSGRLLNGKLFDSSDVHGPVTFKVGTGDAYASIEETILGDPGSNLVPMQKGGVRKAIVPPKLAGQPSDDVPPGSILIYEITLTDIK